MSYENDSESALMELERQKLGDEDDCDDSGIDAGDLEDREYDEWRDEQCRVYTN